MVAPTPETNTSIVLLNGSRVKPIGTLNALLISIQMNSGALIFGCENIKQLQVKLTRTAATEIKLLTDFHRSVNRVINVALIKGASSVIHGNIEFITSPRISDC